MGSKNATVSAVETDDIDPSEYRLLCYWCARKQWGFKDEFVGSQPLNARFFSHLGRLGQVRLTKIHQDELKLALLHYSPPSRSLQACRADWGKIERSARALINAVQVGDYVLSQKIILDIDGLRAQNHGGDWHGWLIALGPWSSGGPHVTCSDCWRLQKRHRGP